MSRAGKLLQRLEHIGEPVLDEDDDDMMNTDDSDGGGEGEEEIAPGMPQQQQQGSMVPPNHPFSKDLRNPDGSMKVGGQDQQPIDDKRGFVRRRM